VLGAVIGSATVAHEPLIEEDDAVLVVGDYGLVGNTGLEPVTFCV